MREGIDAGRHTPRQREERSGMGTAVTNGAEALWTPPHPGPPLAGRALLAFALSLPHYSTVTSSRVTHRGPVQTRDWRPSCTRDCCPSRRLQLHTLPNVLRTQPACTPACRGIRPDARVSSCRTRCG